MRTASMWGKPPARYYKFMRRTLAAGSRKVAVLGCSDGRFVMSFARAGMSVTAVDIDKVALWGGRKSFPDGECTVIGLAGRVRAEGLTDRISVVDGDYVDMNLGEHDAVFTSGSIHYSHNLRHTLAQMIAAIVRTARKGALIYIDYMLPIEVRHSERFNYPREGVIAGALMQHGCTVVYDRYSGPILERAHVEQPQDHYHSLGYVLAVREA